MVEQVEEFALHYWLRAEASALPEPYPELGHGDAAPFLKPLSLCFPADQELSGEGSLQQSYKLRTGGQVGRFPPQERPAIVDLRELDTTYDWITLRSRLFYSNVTVGGVGDDAPSLVVPLRTMVDSVTSAALCENRRAPEPGTLGVFGPGLGLIRGEVPGVLGVSPSMTHPGLRLQHLRVLATGEVRFRGVMIVPRPQQVVHFAALAPDLFLGVADAMTLGAARRWTQPLKEALDRTSLPEVGFDPALVSLQWLNLLTGGRAATELCISKEQLAKEILAKDAAGRQRTLLAARQTYVAAPNMLPQGPERPPPRALEPFSRCGPGGTKGYGWGYEQWYYRLAESGEIGKFPDGERYRTVDLREIGPKYDWVVFKVNIFQFDFTLPPVPTGPQLKIPVPQPVYTVCTPDFVVQDETPRPGVLGEYGYGYSVVPDPTYKTLFAAGPSKITNTIETLSLRVLESGEVRRGRGGRSSRRSRTASS